MRCKIEDLPPRLQEQVRAKLRVQMVQEAPPPAPPVKTTRRRQPTKTERAYRTQIIDRNPAVAAVAYEALTFRLANGHRYTPDWVYWAGSRLHCVEVKGAYRLGSYQRARLAFDQAAVEWPGFVWIWAERNGQGWKMREGANA